MLSARSHRESVASLAPLQFFSGKQVTLVTPVIKVVRTKVAKPALASPSYQAHAMPHTGANIKHAAPSSTASLSSLTSLSSASDVETPATRLDRKRKLQDAPSKHVSKSNASASSSSGSGSDTKKRCVTSTRESGPSTSSARPKPKRRARAGKATRPWKNNNALAPEELVYRKSGSRSRETTVFETEILPPPERKTWTDEDGNVMDRIKSSGDVIKSLGKRYKHYFPHFLDYPTVMLEFPNDGAKEDYILAEPKDKDHYNPLLCAEQTLCTIVKYLVPPEYRPLFGTLPEEVLCIADAEASRNINFSSPLSSLSSSPSSRSSALPASDSENTSPAPSRHSPVPSTNLMRTFIRAKNLRDGYLFEKTFTQINGLIHSLKHSASGDNLLRQAPRAWAKTGIPQGVILRIIEETYQRCVGPNIDKLRNYTSFSSEVYGELMPSFVSDIIAQTGLRSDSLFLDLGSGVGNVVLHAALQTGCRTFGIELLKDPAKLAESQREQMRLRCRMWGVEMGDVELVQGDMTACPRVDELMGQADVVLVNNYVFKEELNAALRPKFLDLKEGAIVVSLKPFAPPSNQRLTERNIDDISAIFDVTTRPYHTGTVSWSSGRGNYYIHRVDREGYRDCRARYEKVQERLRRSVRR